MTRLLLLLLAIVTFDPCCNKHDCILRAYLDLWRCWSGPGTPYVNEECGRFEDADGDMDVDLRDYYELTNGAKP